MKTIEITLYKFSELSEDAKQKALSSLSNINVDHNWWDFVYDDAKTIGLNITSFDLDRNKHAKGELLKTPLQICWLIKENHGEQCSTYKLAESYLLAYNKLPETLEGLEGIEEVFRIDILNCYADILQETCDYLQSKEAVIESIEANDYDFTENGKIY